MPKTIPVRHIIHKNQVWLNKNDVTSYLQAEINSIRDSEVWKKADPNGMSVAAFTGLIKLLSEF